MKIGSTTPDIAGFPLALQITVTEQQIADLMVTFIESGDPVTTAARGGWCWSVETDRHAKKVCTADGPWYADPRFYQQPGFILKIKTNETDTGPEDAKEHLIGACAFHAGLTKLAADKDYCHHLVNLITDNSDAATADIIMQFVVFGEEVFA